MFAGFRARAVALARVCLLVALAAGCAPLVETRDPVLEQGLVNYYATVDRFLTRAAGERTTFKQAEPWYSQTTSRLKALLMLTETKATTVRCVGSDTVSGLLERTMSGLDSLRGSVAAGSQPMLADVRAQLAQRGGSCTVQSLKAILANQELMRAIHEHNDRLAPAVVDILRPTIEQGVRIALTAERAKPQ